MNDEKNIENVSGYSFIGHICHVNLKPEVEPYKNVIGQILLQLPNVKTVVNKTNEINNTYRNFTMEVLAGTDDFHVTVKENYVSFQFDFSKVYWNPRLSTEHGRIAQLLKVLIILNTKYYIRTFGLISYFVHDNKIRFCVMSFSER